jgi:hypothetical protein
MRISDYSGKMAAVASVQRQLDEQLDAIRQQRTYSQTGRKTEMAKAVLAARDHVTKMRSDHVVERETRQRNLARIVFGNPDGVGGSELIAIRDAQDRAAQLDSADDAKAMLHRASQNGDGSLARAVAEAAFNRGWTEVAQDYADQTGKSNALNLLAEDRAHTYENLADTAVFRLRNPEELSLASEPALRTLAELHPPGMGP